MLCSIVLFSALSLLARSSKADCTESLAPLFTAGGADYKLTVATGNRRWVSYSDGLVTFDGSWLSGSVGQLFSDRVFQIDDFHYQPFRQDAADSVSPYVARDGHVWIRNNTWGGWVEFQGTCVGNFLYGFAGNDMFSFVLTPHQISVPH
jgi:hypothetical protein